MPRASDVPALVELLGDPGEARARAGEQGLARLGPAIAADIGTRLRGAAPPLRGRLARVLGRLAAIDPTLAPDVLTLARDPDPKTRRNAIIALGKLPGAAAEQALADLVRDARTDPAHRRSAVDALGKIGSASALPVLRAVDPAGDAELARLLARARIRIARSAGRSVPSAIDDRIAPAAPVPVLYTCRAGLERLLADEIGGDARAAGAGRVLASLHAPLRDVFRARLFLTVGFRLPRAPDLASALASRAALERFRRFTRGPVRYRIAWAAGGHRRAAVLRAARAVSAAHPEIVNDPTASTWVAVVHERPGAVDVVLVPRVPDPRFTYRRRDVPAASHPTIAAALARVAGARPGDVVWDPFVGSGSELIERARLGPCLALHGSDVSRAALSAARSNLAAAGIDAQLQLGDARRGPPRGTTLILTNPPMGRRVPADVRRLLADVIDGAARALPPGGRIVWISPLPEHTAAHAARAGLIATYRQVVDMGGFGAEIQVLISRPPAPSTSAAPRSRG